MEGASDQGLGKEECWTEIITDVNYFGIVENWGHTCMFIWFILPLNYEFESLENDSVLLFLSYTLCLATPLSFQSQKSY